MEHNDFYVYGGFMKKHIILICVILFSIGLLSTVFSSCQRNQATNNDDSGNRRVTRDRGDDDTKTTTSRNTDSTCAQSTRKGGGSCDGDDDCEDQCDDLFNGRDQEECLDLSVNEVQGMWNAFDEDKGILEDPDDDELEEIHPEDIRNALDINERIWDDFIDDYGTSEAGDVLFWIATNECIYEALDDIFDEDDLEGLLADIFDQVDNGGLMAAALEPLGDEADDDETFLYLADQEGNDKAVELVHELLWDQCLASNQGVTAARRAMYNRVTETDDKSSACLLGELYCKQEDEDYIFEDVFENVVKNELDNFIRGGDGASYTDGLGIASSDYDDIEEVCSIICASSGNNRIYSGSTKPATCL